MHKKGVEIGLNIIMAAESELLSTASSMDARLKRKPSMGFSMTDIKMGSKISAGNFGAVYRGEFHQNGEKV